MIHVHSVRAAQNSLMQMAILNLDYNMGSSLLIVFWLDILILSIYLSNLLQTVNPGKKRKRILTEERKAKKTVCYSFDTI
jgi:hypothetical protein